MTRACGDSIAERTPVRERASEPDMRGVGVTTMGRGPADDPAFFSAAFAAGDIAFRVAEGTLNL